MYISILYLPLYEVMLILFFVLVWHREVYITACILQFFALERVVSGQWYVLCHVDVAQVVITYSVIAESEIPRGHSIEINFEYQQLRLAIQNYLSS